MKRSTTHWSLALTAAALLAAPASVLAQTTPPQATTQTPVTKAEQPSAAAQDHLRQARSALAGITTANLSTQARNHVNDLEKRLAALERFAGINDSASATGAAKRSPDATANRGNTKWDVEVAAMDKTLTTLLGPASTTGATDPAATGTTGTTGAANRPAATVKLDDGARTKLMDVRTHITAFATAMAGGDSPAPSADASTDTSATGTTGQSPQTPQTPATQAPSAPVDEEAARRHLTEARNTLSTLTQLPAASQLTGDARTQVSQLISNFNQLITTQAEWRAAYAKVEANLTSLLGPDPATGAATGTAGTGTTGTVGTSGEATAQLDPALREQLVELRRHLNAFEKAAGGINVSSGVEAGTTGATPTTPPAAATGEPPPPATTAPPEPQTAGTAQAGNADLMRHVAAIDTLLAMQDDSGGLTLTKVQVEQFRTHWAALRLALEKK